MTGDWLAAANFEQTHDLVSAINTLSIHAKLALAGAANTGDPAEVEQVGGVAAIEHGERRIERERRRVQPQDAIADRVERAGPRQIEPREPLCAPGHLLRGAARERQQQDPPRIGPVGDELRDAMCERCRLAGAGAGDDQERRVAAILGRFALPSVEHLLI